jgi:anti-anti-sigma factor
MAAQPILHPDESHLVGAASLECPPELIRGHEDRLLTLILPIIERGGLILDMSKVAAIDAAGIGLLVFLRQYAERAGSSLVLMNPSHRLVEVLALVHLDHILLQN